MMHCLTPAEWTSLQIFLTAFTPHDPARLKYVQLARILMEAKSPPNAEACCLKLYGRKKSPGFQMLKTRLKEKVFDFLGTDLSADKQQELDELDYATTKMKKKAALFYQLFFSKKRMLWLYDLLDDIISSAREYEQYIILLDHLKFKKSFVSFKKSDKELERINTEMEFSLKCVSIWNKAEHYYYRIGVLQAFTSKPNRQKALLELEENIAEIKTGFEFTNSSRVHYYMKYLELAYYQLKEDYPQARRVCLELLNIVLNNKSVYRRQRVGVTYVDLSQCEYYLGNFEQVALYAKKAQKIADQSSDNYCIALEQEFCALFAMRQYGQSAEVANKMIASATSKELGEFRYSKFNYLLANTLFKQHKFKQVLQILSQKREISKDKSGWEIGARVLHIMTLIELQKPDEASYVTERLRKFIEFTNKKTPVSLRDKIILKVLLTLEKSEFVFSLLNANLEKHILALRDTKSETRWQPFTHEVIPFHEWLEEKMGKTISRISSPQKESLPGKERREEVLKAVKEKL